MWQTKTIHMICITLMTYEIHCIVSIPGLIAKLRAKCHSQLIYKCIKVGEVNSFRMWINLEADSSEY